MAFSVQQYISKLSLDLQNGLITLEQANDLANKARSLANNRGELGANDRVALRYGVGKSGARNPVVVDDGSNDVNDDDVVADDGAEEPAPAPPADTSTRDAERRMAREEFVEILTNMGFTTAFGFTQAEIDDLTSNITSWIEDGWADGFDGGDKLLMKFRTSKETKNIYAKRFTGMSALAARGQAISEGEYISLETSIRNVLRSSNIDSKFYDSFDDYGRFIAGGVSPDEVRDRITAVQSLINPTIMAELEEYYGIGTGTAEAFLLGLTDEKGVALEAAAQARSQQEIRDIGRNIQIGGMAEASGFRMGMTEAQRLAGTVTGQGLDPFDPRTQGMLQGTFQQSRRIADRERTLAGIDREAYAEMDTLEAAFGDEQKRLASERRGKRERARFSGSAGAAAGSLGVERNF